MDKEEYKPNAGAWKVGWGWYLTLPALAIMALAAKKNIDQTLSQKHQNAIDIIKERYAKGEIDRAKFEEMINDIIRI